MVGDKTKSSGTNTLGHQGKDLNKSKMIGGFFQQDLSCVAKRELNVALLPTDQVQTAVEQTKS